MKKYLQLTKNGTPSIAKDLCWISVFNPEGKTPIWSEIKWRQCGVCDYWAEWSLYSSRKQQKTRAHTNGKIRKLWIRLTERNIGKVQGNEKGNATDCRTLPHI